MHERSNTSRGCQRSSTCRIRPWSTCTCAIAQRPAADPRCGGAPRRRRARPDQWRLARKA